MLLSVLPMSVFASGPSTPTITDRKTGNPVSSSTDTWKVGTSEDYIEVYRNDLVFSGSCGYGLRFMSDASRAVFSNLILDNEGSLESAVIVEDSLALELNGTSKVIVYSGESTASAMTVCGDLTLTGTGVLELSVTHPAQSTPTNSYGLYFNNEGSLYNFAILKVNEIEGAMKSYGIYTEYGSIWNSGTLEAAAKNGLMYSEAIVAEWLDNAGDVTATQTGYSANSGAIYAGIDNTGSITANSAYGYGINAGLGVYSSGTITASSGNGNAAVYSEWELVNYGTITAYGNLEAESCIFGQASQMITGTGDVYINGVTLSLVQNGIDPIVFVCDPVSMTPPELHIDLLQNIQPSAVGQKPLPYSWSVAQSFYGNGRILYVFGDSVNISGSVRNIEIKVLPYRAADPNRVETLTLTNLAVDNSESDYDAIDAYNDLSLRANGKVEMMCRYDPIYMRGDLTFENFGQNTLLTLSSMYDCAIYMVDGKLTAKTGTAVQLNSSASSFCSALEFGNTPSLILDTGIYAICTAEADSSRYTSYVVFGELGDFYDAKDENGNVAHSVLISDQNLEKDHDTPIGLIYLLGGAALTLGAGTLPMLFNDVKAGAWYSEAVDFCSAAGIMNGVGGGSFAPNDNLTRAMVVTMLWRMVGEPTAAACAFDDVAQDTWYSAAINWAAEKGIVNGMNAKTFAPNSNVTKEQLFTILYRFAKMNGADVFGTTYGYDDAACVSDWAASGVGYAAEKGMIYTKDGLIYPQTFATRAEAAYAFYKFCN